MISLVSRRYDLEEEENEDEASLETGEYTLSQDSEERVERLRKYTPGRLWNNAGGAGALH